MRPPPPAPRTRLRVRAALGAAQALAERVHGRLARLRTPGGRGPARAAAGPRGGPAALPEAAGAALRDLVAFWSRAAPDPEHGGFLTDLDRWGRPGGPGHKHVIMQARLVWTFATAHAHGLGDGGLLDLADRGVGFLTTRLWDSRAGGFAWAVDRDGAPLDARKDATAQAFGIYALVAHARASGDAGSLAWAERAFDVLRDRADAGASGFGETFAPDWTPVPGPGGAARTVGAHLHLMEAFAALAEATGRAEHRRAAARVAALLVRHAVDPATGATGEAFDDAWRPLRPAPGPAPVSYGHAVELAWLALAAPPGLGLAAGPARTRLLAVIDHALAWGFDHRRGGLARHGPRLGRAAAAVYLHPRRLHKVWWVQAEMLAALAEAWRQTGAPRYLAALARQFGWIDRYQVDHEAGGWFEAVTWRRGRPLRWTKAHRWKDPYHETRALLHVRQALGERPPVSGPAPAPAGRPGRAPGGGAG
jgi:mannobiose 2-epimerase